jgi:hypothetical protein
MPRLQPYPGESDQKGTGRKRAIRTSSWIPESSQKSSSGPYRRPSFYHHDHWLFQHHLGSLCEVDQLDALDLVRAAAEGEEPQRAGCARVWCQRTAGFIEIGVSYCDDDAVKET